jgi:DNA-binding PadR family transcriptional regulator
MTNAEFTILSLIFEQPRHGYDIEKIIEERGMREWTEVGFSSIYYLLNKLLKKEYALAVNKASESKGPGKKVYHITEAGRKYCIEKTEFFLTEPGRYYAPILLGLSNAAVLNRKDVITALQKYGEQLKKRKKNVCSRHQSQQPLPDEVNIMFDYSKTIIKAEMSWLANSIRILKGKSNESGL